MSWFGFGSRKPAPSTTNLQTQKTKQIESLTTVSASFSETLRDAEYRASFPVEGTNYILVILLPSQFPQERPIVKVEPPLHHPWVDNHMCVTHCPALLTFSMHSSLGAAVQSIIDEFRSNPPQPITQHPPPYSAVDTPPTYPAAESYSNTALYQSQQASSTSTRIENNTSHQIHLAKAQSIGCCYSMPEVPKTFSVLKDKSLCELDELMNDEAQLLDVIQSLPEVTKLAKDREEMSLNCASLARENLSRKPRIQDLKKELIERFQLMSELQHEFEKSCERQAVLSDQYHPSNIQTHLKVAVLESEEESERIADDLLDKRRDVEQFCHQYIDQRTRCHIRKAKEEKLQQLILTHVQHF